ncbi:hypothetical protein EHS25_006667 [Saitozyma podzolica]|uniref:Uncharacterized protein n=1 Tax=Saitozyma podzolica TaxID=1890683 RepID=A0A427YSB2_9TREE|nr:hypothetical protein EHS25_006667 [Saitozyma podzolica]
MLTPTCVVSPLLVARALKVSFFNPFRRAQAENASGQIIVQVKWNRERFNIPVPNPSVTPLSQLLATLSSHTGIPVPQLKLIYKGAVLKDPSLTISSYGLTDGSLLVLVGKDGDVPSAPPPSTAPPAAKVGGKKKQPETTTESVLVEYIRGLVSGLLDPLEPAIRTFISHTDPNATNKPAQSQKFEVLQREHARLSELLLRGLLDLDGVEIPSGWAEARKERKEAVKTVQAQLTRVDQAWGERKRIGG